MLRIALVSAAALALSSCANICDRYASYEDSLKSKTTNCSVFHDNLPTTTFNRDTCNSNLSKCTSDDIKKMNDMLDCMDKLPACTESTLQTWATSMGECGKKSEGISQACSDAMSAAQK